MRMSEFVDKKIINIYDGEIMGTAGDSDLLVDPQSGQILELILPSERGFGLFANKDRRQYSIPWSSVKKVGAEVIVVDVDDNAKLVR